MTVDAESGFWQGLDCLVREHNIIIDRPYLSNHLRWADKIYPLDYGYLEGLGSADGEGLDVWIGKSGTGTVTALLCSVDLFKQDVEIKLLVGCSEDEIAEVTAFTNEGMLRCMVIRRSPDNGSHTNSG